ncbi:MAG TPA: response regulator transcription factor [Dehalococcoidia bacterium]|nr:response regulator transcription factor [Dehalococcoidia bacterium]
MSESPIRVLLVDDHEVVREGLKALLNRREGMTVVGEAGTVAQSVEVAVKVRPDVVVMDLRLPDGSGIEACREIRSELPGTKVIMLTSYADQEAVMSSILGGASAYLLKQTRGSQLAEAIEGVARGESLLDPAVTLRVLEEVRKSAAGKSKAASPEAQLTENEQKILHLIAEGKTNREIAAEIYLSDKTVKNYVSNILSKLNMKRRSEAAAYITRRDIQDPSRNDSGG